MAYHPDELRDHHGRWTGGGGVVHDAKELARRGVELKAIGRVSHGDQLHQVFHNGESIGTIHSTPKTGVHVATPHMREAVSGKLREGAKLKAGPFGSRAEAAHALAVHADVPGVHGSPSSEKHAGFNIGEHVSWPHTQGQPGRDTGIVEGHSSDHVHIRTTDGRLVRVRPEHVELTGQPHQTQPALDRLEPVGAQPSIKSRSGSARRQKQAAAKTPDMHGAIRELTGKTQPKTKGVSSTDMSAGSSGPNRASKTQPNTAALRGIRVLGEGDNVEIPTNSAYGTAVVHRYDGAYHISTDSGHSFPPMGNVEDAVGQVRSMMLATTG